MSGTVTSGSASATSPRTATKNMVEEFIRSATNGKLSNAKVSQVTTGDNAGKLEIKSEGNPTIIVDPSITQAELTTALAEANNATTLEGFTVTDSAAGNIGSKF